jgi:hypothetical protein
MEILEKLFFTFNICRRKPHGMLVWEECVMSHVAPPTPFTTELISTGVLLLPDFYGQALANGLIAGLLTMWHPN